VIVCRRPGSGKKHIYIPDAKIFFPGEAPHPSASLTSTRSFHCHPHPHPLCSPRSLPAVRHRQTLLAKGRHRRRRRRQQCPGSCSTPFDPSPSPPRDSSVWPPAVCMRRSIRLLRHAGAIALTHRRHAASVAAAMLDCWME
jgi:hypothetical protein